MQLHNEFAPVMKSSNDMETGEATIELTSHMFDILSIGIYEHPEEACVRELSCNALDGQAAAGNASQPFNVHLPNRLEPYFEVRDFGTGMTHEQVMKLYLTYGASTKRDSNDQIGGLGIGSKSPFAVAQSFTVTVFQNGIVRRYSVYRENGKPRITKLTESETTEPNGVAVRVAVSMDKIQKFHEVAQKIYTHFPVKPNCNVPLVSLYHGKSILAEVKDQFTVYSGSNSGDLYVDTSVVMGNIEYPINLYDVMADPDKCMPKFLRRNIDKLLIYMPIGSVSIAASRESLQLSDSTRKQIVSVFEKVSSQILSAFQTKIDAAPNLYEAVRVYDNAMAGQRVRDHAIMEYLKYGGKTLEEWRLEQNTCRTREVIDPKTGLTVKDYHGHPKREFIYDDVPYVTLRRMINSSKARWETRTANTEESFSIFNGMKPNGAQPVFVIQDRRQKNGNIKTAGQYAVMKALCESVYNKDLTDRMVFLFKTEKDIKDLRKLHHYPDDFGKVLKMSDFESAYVPAKVTRGQVKVWKGTASSQPEEVKVSADDFDEPQYYIKAEGHTVLSDTLKIRSYDAMDFLKRIPALLPTKQLFLFRKTVWNKIPEDWIEVDVKVIEQAVAGNPHWWINYNRKEIKNYSRRFNQLDLTRMYLRLNTKFEGNRICQGYEHEVQRNVPNPQLANFEDNFEVIRDMFGRPQLVFGEEFYVYYDDTWTELSIIYRILPDGHKLRESMKRVDKRIEQKVKQEIEKADAKNRLLSWVDWSKVTFRDAATELGYTVTPYVSK